MKIEEKEKKLDAKHYESFRLYLLSDITSLSFSKASFSSMVTRKKLNINDRLTSLMKTYLKAEGKID